MTNSHRTVVLFLVLLFFSATLFFFRLGERGLRNPDEGRYAEIAREMTVTGNWIEPKIYGVDYLKKPPLFYWLTAASIKIFGFNEWAARSVPALFGVFGVLMTFWFTRRILDEETAFFSGLVLATNFWYLQVGRYLVIDAVFSFFVMSGLYFFYSAHRSKENKRLYYLLFYGCVSLSFLAKGILGMILPGISIAITLLKNKKLGSTLKEMSLGWGALIFSLIALPWFIVISLKSPEFLRLFFLHENLSRFTSKSFEHQEVWYFYLVLLPIIFMPWVLFAKPIRNWAAFLKEDRGWGKEKFFLWATGLSFVLFFSLSRGKLLTYILPSVPFFSILIGKTWRDRLKEEEIKKTQTHWTEVLPIFLLLFLGMAVVTSAPAVISRFGQEWPESVGVYFQIMGAVILAGAVVGLRAWRRPNRQHLFYVLVLMMAIISIPFSFAMEQFNTDYTNKHFAKNLKPRLKSGDKVFVYDHPGALYDFGFYLDHPVTLVGLEGELEFSKEDPKNQKAVLTHEEFWKLLRENEKLYCLARKSDFLALTTETKKSFNIIQEDRRKVLFST